ncbi:hypothetical protein M6B38_366690 [Iris pallida]|uniref:Uncharacterized protein n=1 Tax=Iris pallida TaxID=29817 RepID=A0AAX6GHF8_IRIPA|nr:hypothetical protein M6B38_366690 [Iris pallida]
MLMILQLELNFYLNLIRIDRIYFPDMYGYFTVIFPNHCMDIVGMVANAAAMNSNNESIS